MSVVAVVLLAGHAIALALVKPATSAVLFSDLFQLAVAMLTVFACYQASRRSLRFARSFWFVIAAAFALWALARPACNGPGYSTQRSSWSWWSAFIFISFMCPH